MEPTTFLRFVTIIEKLPNTPSKLNSSIDVFLVKAEYVANDGIEYTLGFEQIAQEPHVPFYMAPYEIDLLKYQWYHKAPDNRLMAPLQGQAFWLRYFRGYDCLFDDIIFFKSVDTKNKMWLFDHPKMLPYQGNVVIEIGFDKFLIRYNECRDNLLYGHILLPLESVDDCLRTGQRNKG